jgi:hypothetical protein
MYQTAGRTTLLEREAFLYGIFRSDAFLSRDDSFGEEHKNPAFNQTKG